MKGVCMGNVLLSRSVITKALILHVIDFYCVTTAEEIQNNIDKLIGKESDLLDFGEFKDTHGLVHQMKVDGFIDPQYGFILADRGNALLEKYKSSVRRALGIT